jgi:hypothetical protein
VHSESILTANHEWEKERKREETARKNVIGIDKNQTLGALKASTQPISIDFDEEKQTLAMPNSSILEKTPAPSSNARELL